MTFCRTQQYLKSILKINIRIENRIPKYSALYLCKPIFADVYLCQIMFKPKSTHPDCLCQIMFKPKSTHPNWCCQAPCLHLKCNFVMQKSDLCWKLNYHNTSTTVHYLSFSFSLRKVSPHPHWMKRGLDSFSLLLLQDKSSVSYCSAVWVDTIRRTLLRTFIQHHRHSNFL